MSTWSVVVPSCRPESLRAFVDAWGDYFHRRAELIVVRDLPPWTGIPDSPAIPRRTDAVRSWGIAQAIRTGCDRILTLDDDVLPVAGVDLLAEYDAVFDSGAPVSPHLSVGALTGTGLEMRGAPVDLRTRRRVAWQVGGWDGVPDLDAQTQLAHPDAMVEQFARLVLPVPVGVLTTVCAMNLAAQSDRAVWLWQLPLVDECRYLRWHDIWAGVIAKRCADAAGEAVVINGRASVRHARASDPLVNAEREAPGYSISPAVWERVRGGSFVEVTDSFADVVRECGDPEYADHLLRARDAWLDMARP